MEEEGKTYKICIRFDIDVPHNVFRSDLNTAVLLLNEISHLEYCNELDVKVRNHLIEQLKSTLDKMKIIEMEGD